MTGHGSPQGEFVRLALNTMRLTRRDNQRRSLTSLLCAVVACLYFLFPVDLRAADPIELRLRITWGSGAARQWEGELEVAGGTYSTLVDLGVSPDSPGSKFITDRRVITRSPSVSSFDGMDITIQGSVDAPLVLLLRPSDQPAAVTRLETTLGHFISRNELRTLDMQGNQLMIRRVPGDRLRTWFARDSLVFAPRELFEMTIEPHLLEVEPNANLRVQLQLFPARSEREVWSHQASILADAGGRFSRQTLDPIPLPADEGAYDIVLTLHRRPRIGVPLWRSPPLVQRKVQVVVIDPTRRVPDAGQWRDELTIDPANPRWRTWTARWQSLVRLPGFDQSKPLAGGQPREASLLGQKMLQLSPGEWQAYPMPVGAAERPHMLEIEYPSHLAQTLGVSIIEPNEAGEVVPLCVDSGIHVSAPPADAEPSLERHRIVFWPRTTAPVILLTNLGSRGAAIFGKIRLSSGPDHLSPAPLDLPTNTSRSQRLLAAFFDKPLFPANFSARDASDADARQSPEDGKNLDDWKKFHDGAQRLIEYLKYAGYNGAVINVARDGSTIYPSEVLATTPRFDNGVFFSTGQDAVRKDVLEMLFRMFDREGLQLVPAVHFSGRVASLEQIRRRSRETTGPELIDARGRVAATHYNPLDPRVQEVIQGAIRELAERYGEHESYGGVAVQLGVDSYLTFPDIPWGLDPLTFGRFAEATGQPTQLLEDARTPAERATLLENPERQRAWLEWRAIELGRLFSELQRIGCRSHDHARLYLAPVDLLEGTVPQRLLRPTPSAAQLPMASVMLRLGIDANLYRDNAQLVLLKPQRLAPGRSLNERAVDIHLATSSEVDSYFAGDEPRERMAAETGSLFFHERITQGLPSFDAVSPFGPDRTRTQLVTHAAPAGWHNRKRFVQSLAAADSQTMFDGGWLIPLGQEDVLLPLMETYRLLPRGRFGLVAPRSEVRTQPVVVRQRREAGVTWFYMVNDSPWKTLVSLEIDCAENAELRPLGQRAFSKPQSREGGLEWRIALAPYDVVAARIHDESATVTDWQTHLSPHVFADLERQLREVGVRANLALERPPLDLLRNGDFEQTAETDKRVPGWQFKRGEHISVELDGDDKYKGRHSLRMSSEGPVLWVRSAPFAPPDTGRLYVLVRLKVRDPSRQPRLRVALDNEKGFYWPLPVGADSSMTRLPSTWNEDFLFPFEQLPLGELDQLHLGFDLMGEGEVWIDDIQMFDIWLQREDRNALLMSRGLATKNLERYAKVSYCQRFLEGFWPQFLMEHVAPDTRPPDSRTAVVPVDNSADSEDTPPSADPEWRPRTAMERLYDFVPKVPTLPAPLWR